MDILQQLGQLVLGSVPTMLLFLFLVVTYRFLVHRPLTQLLERRREQTQGAMDKAKQAISAAESKTEDYEEKLRAARKAVQAAREAQMQQWSENRDEALTAAQQAAHERVRQARTEINTRADESRRTIESASQQLAAQIVSHLLSPAATNAERAH